MNKQNKGLQSSITVAFLATICCFLWGSAFPTIKIGYNAMKISSNDIASQMLYAGVRFTLAGLITVMVGSIQAKKLLLPKKSNIKYIGILSMFQTVIQYFFFYVGLANTTGVKASVIDSSNIFIAIFLTSLVFKMEKLTVKKVVGSIIGFAGVVIINLGDGFSLSFNLLGDGFIFISACGYALSSIYMKKFSVKENPILLSGWQFVLGGIILSIAGLISGGSFTTFNVKCLFIILYLAAISCIAYSIWSLLLKYNPVSRITVFGFMNPVFGVILSSLWLNEASQALGVKSIIALLLACLGIFIVNYKHHRRC